MRLPSHQELLRTFSYDPETGWLTRLASKRSDVVGKRSGCPGRHARYVWLAGALHKEHRVIWCLVTGAWPTHEIDHVNRDPHDNRWCNLRLASHSDNLLNRAATKTNRIGLKGVSYCKCTSRYRAQIKVNGKSVSLGRFDTPQAAHEAYCRAVALHHGEFGRTA